MDDTRLINAIFELVEQVTGAELSSAGRKLIVTYFRESGEPALAGKARRAVRRYAQWEPPSMDVIRERHRAGSLDELDWRVLKVENEARKLEELGPRR